MKIKTNVKAGAEMERRVTLPPILRFIVGLVVSVVGGGRPISAKD